MPSHPSNEERPRITITAERHDELVASETRLKELHGAGLRALELVGRTMIAHVRRGVGSLTSTRPRGLSLRRGGKWPLEL